ncbi:hypothetical protein KKH43_05400 [Patescibacteria group bacterium]|nr:hypothetical protein [Patescibacteria group bacterium]
MQTTLGSVLVLLVDDSDDKRTLAMRHARRIGFTEIKVLLSEFNDTIETATQQFLAFKETHFGPILIILDGTWSTRGEIAAKEGNFEEMDCVLFLKSLARRLSEDDCSRVTVIVDSTWPPEDFSIFPSTLMPLQSSDNSLSTLLSVAAQIISG